MDENKDLVYLQHIFDATIKIEKYLKDQSFADFIGNDMMIDAVVREMEIIGEAAGNVSEEFQEKYKDIPWSSMIGMRNRLIHGYFGVDFKIVWQTCQEDLVELKKLIELII